MGQNIKKKIIIFMPSIEEGGVEKNLFIITNYLSTRIKNLYLLSISKKYKKKFHKSVNFITLNSNFWDKLGRKIKYILSIFLLIKLFLKDRNVVVFAFQANIYCIIVCKIFFVKVITRSNTAPIGWSNNPIKRILYKFFLSKADAVIVNSQEFKKEMKTKFGINCLKIYNPLNFFEIKKKSLIKKKGIFGKNRKTLKILNIGRFTDQKDQITLLKALNNLKNKIDFRAVIMGDGPYKKQLEDFIKSNSLQKIVFLKKFEKNPYPFIRMCDLFILSSIYEGLPNVLLEAITLKKFVISSNCPTGPKEILLNGKGGYIFKTGNYKDLSNKIINYYLKKKECVSMRSYSYKKLNRFDFKLNLNRYLILVKQYL